MHIPPQKKALAGGLLRACIRGCRADPAWMRGNVWPGGGAHGRTALRPPGWIRAAREPPTGHRPMPSRRVCRWAHLRGVRLWRSRGSTRALGGRRRCVQRRHTCRYEAIPLAGGAIEKTGAPDGISEKTNARPAQTISERSPDDTGTLRPSTPNSVLRPSTRAAHRHCPNRRQDTD